MQVRLAGFVGAIGVGKLAGMDNPPVSNHVLVGQGEKVSHRGRGVVTGESWNTGFGHELWSGKMRGVVTGKS